MTTSGEKGYVSETALAVDDALVWKVGGNTVTANGVFGTNAAYDLIFRTNSTERMRILANGNVGIGITIPQSKLDVNGFILTQGLAITNTSAAYREIGFQTNGSWRWDNYVQGSETGSDAGSDWYLSRYNDVGGYQGNVLFIKRNNGFFGINTVSPTAQFDNAGTTRLRSLSSGLETDSVMTVDGSGNLRKRTVPDLTGWVQVGNNMYSYKSGNGGNVGINTNNPTEKLTISGRLDFNGDNTVGGTRFGLGYDNTNNYGWLQTWNAKPLYLNPLGNNIIFNRDGGNVGIGTTSPATKLHVNGTITGSVLTNGSIDITGATINKSGGIIEMQNAGGSGVNVRYFGGTANPIMMLGSNGYMGIGTNTPTSRLDITGGDLNVSGQGRFKGWYTQGTGLAVEAGVSASQGYLMSYDRTSSVYQPLNISGSTINMGVGGSSAIFIDGTNKVGIGTTTPSTKLDVNGFLTGQGMVFDNTAVSYRELAFKSSGQYRWSNYVIGAETGSNVGSDWFLSRYSDAGGYLGNALFAKRSNGFVGINNISPSQQLDVSGTTKTTNLQVTNGAGSGYIATSDGSGNLSWSASIADARLSANIPRLNTANSYTQQQSFNTTLFNDDATFGAPIFGQDADFVGTVSAANATSATHLMNRQSSDIRYGQLSAANTWTATNTFATTTELKNNTSTAPSVKITNATNGKTSATWIANGSTDLNNIIGNYTAIGDVVIDATNGTQSITGLSYARKDFHFEQNGKQLANVSFTDSNDSSFVNVTSTTRYLRVYKSSAVTTTKLRVNLPSNPQNNARITILIQDDITSLDLKAENAGQSIISAIQRVTPVAGEVIEVWFDSESEGSPYGRWYCKKL